MEKLIPQQQVEETISGNSKIFIEKVMDIKKGLDFINADITKKEKELQLYKEEKLRLEGAYRYLLEVGISLGFIKTDTEDKSEETEK